MGVSRRRSLRSIDNFCPKFSFEIILKEIIQLLWSIMPSKNIHWVFVNDCISPITSFWPWLDIILSQISPFISFKSKFKKIVFILSIIASKNIHWLIINDCWMTMSWTWRISSSREQDFLPRILQNVVLKEVIHSVKPIIASKNKDRVFICDWYMSISSTWGHIFSFDLIPNVSLNIILEKVIFATHPVVSSKNVYRVFITHTSM